MHAELSSNAVVSAAAHKQPASSPGVVYSRRISGASLTRSDCIPLRASSDVSLFQTCTTQQTCKVASLCTQPCWESTRPLLISRGPGCTASGNKAGTQAGTRLRRSPSADGLWLPEFWLCCLMDSGCSTGHDCADDCALAWKLFAPASTCWQHNVV